MVRFLLVVFFFGSAPLRVQSGQTDPSFYTKYFAGTFEQPEIGDVNSRSTACPGVAAFPLDVGYGAFGTFIQGRALICGGSVDKPVVGAIASNRCFVWIVEKNSWQETASLGVGRVNAAAAQLSADLWWVTGGNTRNGVTNSTELYDAIHSRFTPYIDLPFASDHHSLVSVNATHVVAVDYNSDSVFYFDSTTLAWSMLSTLPQDHFFKPMSGLVEYPDGTTGILVAGGAVDRTAQFLNLADLTWAEKASLPHTIDYGVAVPFGKSLLAVGGLTRDSRVSLRTIYYYDADDDHWQLMRRTEREKTNLPVFLISDQYARCTETTRD